MEWVQMISMQLDLAGFILMALLAVMLWTLVLAQRDDEFDIKQSMLDDNGKVSFLRLSGLGAFAFHSWVLMKDTLSVGGADVTLFISYGVIWSGAPIAGKLIEVMAAVYAARNPKKPE